ncbi:hypothetical protein GOBAR_DD26911 [Gossypium barbadense]|nr:hypothetical protein GOBAR_DD26911 [Gossypium barbadense]
MHKTGLLLLPVITMRKHEIFTVYVVLAVVVVVCFNAGTVYAKYDTGARIVPGKLNVHLVPHSHDDVGWLKTVDQYYVGSNNSIQGACVQNVLDSVVDALLRDPNRKFVFAEMAFFQRWWTEQSSEIQEQVKELVDAGRLEFVNGGWCMHDEAATHYIDMIDQTTLGHRAIKEQFNNVPRAGWQIDPFGHSAVQSYLLGAEVGFDSMHFARIDYQDRAQRKNKKSLEVIWQGSNTFGSSSQAETVVSSALSCLTKNNSGDKCEESGNIFSQCQLVNISYCPPTEQDIPQGKSLVVVVYNSLAWNRTDIVRIPVNDTNLVVQDSSGNNIDTQFIALDNVTINVREFYTKAYLGLPSDSVPKYWLLFQVSIPALGWNTYFISKGTKKGRGTVGMVSAMPQEGTIEIGQGNLKMSFSTSSGQLQRMYNSRTGVDVPLQQSYLWYGSSSGGSDFQASGAYIFRPDGESPTVVSRSVPLNVTRGPLVDEVYQQFNEWIYQVTRLYKDKEHAEIEFTIGPIPLDDGVGKEIITQLTANMVTNKEFYTDSNGRDFLKRVRDFREDWNLTVTQPVAGNYYPVFMINLGIYTVDKKSELSVLVDRATGGSSIKDGEIELMLHRRMLYDDSRGVGEALDESVCVGNTCEGLTIRGNYYFSIDRKGEGARWRRTTGQEVYSPVLLAFTYENMETWKSSHLTKATAMDPGYTLPLNVALITLQELSDGTALLRLAHLYEEGEDSTYSHLAKVELKKMFNGRTIKEVQEMSLTTNQVKSEMKKLSWKVEGDNGKQPSSPIRGGPVTTSTLIVELGPMEIRTFLLKF